MTKIMKVLLAALLVLAPVGAKAQMQNPSSTPSTIIAGAYNASSCGTGNAPGWCSGSDIGAWVNAAVAAGNGGTIQTPVKITIDPTAGSSGQYSQTTQISLPQYSQLDCQGAQLNWQSTSGAAVVITGSRSYIGNQQPLTNCIINTNVGTPATNTNVGIFLGGDPLGVYSPTNSSVVSKVITNVSVAGFNKGVYYGNNTFAVTFNGFVSHGNYDGMYSPKSNTTSTALTNVAITSGVLTATVGATAPNTANTGTAASSSGVTVTYTPGTGGFAVGQTVTVTSGTGTIPTGDTITQIISGTQFKLTNAPSVALSGATISGSAQFNVGDVVNFLATSATFLNTIPLTIASVTDATHFTANITHADYPSTPETNSTVYDATSGVYNSGELFRVSNFDIYNNIDCGYYSQDINMEFTFSQGSFDYNGNTNPGASATIPYTSAALCGTGIQTVLNSVHLEQYKSPFADFAGYGYGTAIRMLGGSIAMAQPAPNITAYSTDGSGNVTLTVSSTTNVFIGQYYKIAGFSSGAVSLNTQIMKVTSFTSSTITGSGITPAGAISGSDTGVLHPYSYGLFNSYSPSGSTILKDIFLFFNSGTSAWTNSWVYTAGTTNPSGGAGTICIQTPRIGAANNGSGSGSSIPYADTNVGSPCEQNGLTSTSTSFLKVNNPFTHTGSIIYNTGVDGSTLPAYNFTSYWGATSNTSFSGNNAGISYFSPSYSTSLYTAPITNFSLTSNTLTLTVSNSSLKPISSGSVFYISGLTTGTYLNYTPGTSSPVWTAQAGTNSTTIVATASGFSHADVGSTADSGVATIGTDRKLAFGTTAATTLAGLDSADLYIGSGAWNFHSRYYSFGPTPTASTGTVDTASYSSDDQHGAITGLAAATSVTLTFGTTASNTLSAGSWQYIPSCSATPSVSLATPPYVSAVSTTAVTFTFPSLTGTLYYQCH